MKSETEDQISASTKYRYAKAKRESDLSDFLEFKKDNLVIITSSRMLLIETKSLSSKKSITMDALGEM